MNQVHYGGLWGPLHNYSKILDVQVTQFERLDARLFTLNFYRDKGPETYGSFLIRFDLVEADGDTLHTYRSDYLKQIDQAHIQNKYINEIQAGANSLVVPLGAKATVEFELPKDMMLKADEKYTFIFTDISGRKFIGKEGQSRFQK